MSDDMLYFAKDQRRRPFGIKAKNTHTLVIGMPSSGKTKLLDAFILSALSTNVNNLVVIIDPKETGFQAWKDFLRVRVFQDSATFSNVFEALMQEHYARTAIMADEGVEEMPEYMRRVYVIVDELPSLVSDTAIITKQATQSISANMVQLLRLSRQTGIQLVAASQSAEGKNLISANARGLYANRILLSCMNPSEAEMLMNANADDLRLDTLIPGEAWIKTGNLDLARCWIDYYPNDKLRKEIASLPVGEPDFSFLEMRNL